MSNKIFRLAAALALAGALLLAPAAAALPAAVGNAGPSWATLWGQLYTWFLESLGPIPGVYAKAGPVPDPNGGPAAVEGSTGAPSGLGEKAGPTADPDGEPSAGALPAPGETAGPTADPNG